MDVLRWAKEAEFGEVVTYHVEHYATDVLCDGQQRVEALAARGASLGTAMQAHVAGLVFLAQRRVRTGAKRGGLQYQATRISVQTALKLHLVDRKYAESISYVAAG